MPEIHLPTENVLAASIMGIMSVCLMTKAEYEDWIFHLANRLGLTNRADDKSVWDRVFDNGSVVTIRDMETTNTYYGEVYLFSDRGSQRELLLQDVDVYDNSSNFLYHMDFLYLSREHNRFTIEKRDLNMPESTQAEEDNVEKRIRFIQNKDVQ